MSDKLPACRGFRQRATQRALDKLAACRGFRQRATQDAFDKLAACRTFSEEAQTDGAMKKQMARNFGAAAEDYARFRAGFPDSFFDRLAALGIGASGETIVDVGTGTGTLARGFAIRDCKVIGVDPDGRLLDQARRLDVATSVTVEYKIGSAEVIPLPDGVADVVSAGQCWHWFDGQKAAREFSRIAKSRGRVVVAYFSWLPLTGNVVEATERLIMKHNRNWSFGGGIGVDFRSLP